MRVCVLLVYVLLLTAYSFSKELDRKLKVDVDFPGNDVLRIFSPDVHHCQLACTQHHSCDFFTFLSGNWTEDNRQFSCYLKHTALGLPLNHISLKNVISGFPHTFKEKTTVCLPVVYTDMDFTGADYRTLFTGDYEGCQRECTKDRFCRFFSFLTKDFPKPELRHKCHLKFSWDVPVPPTIKALDGVESGFSQKPQVIESNTSSCDYGILSDTDFPGGDYEHVQAASPEHCRFLCSSHPRCTYFSYSSAKFKSNDPFYHMRCFLKHNVNTKPTVTKKEVHSGMPQRACEPSKSWVTEVYHKVDFTGADKTFFLTDDPKSCQQRCTSEPSCQFYTYVFPSFHAPLHRKRCYLKQVITLPVPPTVVSMEGVVSGFDLRGCNQHPIA